MMKCLAFVTTDVIEFCIKVLQSLLLLRIRARKINSRLYVLAAAAGSGTLKPVSTSASCQRIRAINCPVVDQKNVTIVSKWSVHWSVHWSVNWTAHWSIHWSVHWPVHWSVNWTVHWSVHWSAIISRYP